MTKLIIILTVALGAITLDASAASAASCTQAYAKCLNDSYELEGFLQSMADLECGAEYVGCVGRKLAFM